MMMSNCIGALEKLCKSWDDVQHDLAPLMGLIRNQRHDLKRHPLAMPIQSWWEVRGDGCRGSNAAWARNTVTRKKACKGRECRMDVVWMRCCCIGSVMALLAVMAGFPQHLSF